MGSEMWSHGLRSRTAIGEGTGEAEVVAGGSAHALHTHVAQLRNEHRVRVLPARSQEICFPAYSCVSVPWRAQSTPRGRTDIYSLGDGHMQLAQSPPCQIDR